MCSHKLNIFRNIICSEVAPAKCEICGASLVRTHKMASWITKTIFSVFGIPYLVLVVILFEYLPWLLIGTVIIILAGYIWDTATTQPVEYTERAKEKYRATTKKALTILFLFLVVVFISENA